MPSFARIYWTSAAWVVCAMALASFFCSPARAQAPNVVFQSAYQRVFTITDCTNVLPIVVTIATPAADDPIIFVPLDDGSLVTITGVLGNTNCNVTDNAITTITGTTFSLTGVTGNGAYVSGGVGQSDTISDATTPSIPMPNLGQGGHLISVEFPTAVGTVTPIQVRIEKADVCTDPPFCATGDWVPISEDVVEATSVGGIFYFLVRANGVWRSIRVNSVLATPTTLPMRVDYTGFPSAIGNIALLGDRFSIAPPNSASGLEIEYVMAACQTSTATLNFNGGNTTTLPTPACVQTADVVTAVAEFPVAGACVDDEFRFSPSVQPPTLEFDVIWQSADTDTVEWDLDYCCQGPGDTLATCGVSAGPNETRTPSGANELNFNTIQFMGSDSFVPFLCQAGDMFMWRFCRNVGGTSAVVVDVKSVMFRGGN